MQPSVRYIGVVSAFEFVDPSNRVLVHPEIEVGKNDGFIETVLKCVLYGESDLEFRHSSWGASIQCAQRCGRRC